ncbi:Gfo/Idh/MocA family oxidoreductase [Acidisoma cellulosilytica]|uniref:Gfo/Idh/MocA family oxidoreductase n=1 Tax=Acidisoma cellulosilyticum TaxID=2802395 RepID=A0A964E5F0_9PROT|nr:Gfo/Idh/MocA family oxidoreductase [Acidisoma cellulosilyticum]MCB8882481.1 Gfo/Idh/MocA family oxidoreductase [Acidisoma cellulosilyticum]
MGQTVNWGILSTAKIGREKVIPAMQKGAVSRVLGIASRDQASAQTTADALGIPRAYGTYEALLADPDIQAIYNPLPNHLHVPWSIKALEAGKHVLCEKPVALDTKEAELLLAARDRTGLVVAEAFMVRYAPWWQRVRALVQEGRLGRVSAIQTAFSYFLDDPQNIRNMPEIGGGGLMDIGCYAIATARYIWGSEPTRAAALIDRDPAMGTDRLTSALVQFPEGHLTFTCSTQLVPHQRVTVMGTKARIEVLIPFNASPDEPVQILIDEGKALGGVAALTEEFSPTDQYTLQGDAVSRVILGEAKLEFPLEDAIANMRVIEAIFRAGDKGSWEAP